jgi:AraC-like DNA-binding protein
MDSSGPLRSSTRERRRAVFRDAAAIVVARYSEPLTVDEISRLVASSPRQLRRAFTEEGGLSFREFVAGVRMRNAAQLLAETDLPVAEVGRRVGYREPSRFSKAFRRTYRMSPSEFRARSGGSGTA